MTTRSPILIGLAAIVLTAGAMAMGGTGALGHVQEAPGPAPVQGVAQQLPFACSLVARPDGGGTALEARMQAREAISASYDLQVRGPGVSIDQGGDLTLAAGETTVLGEASVSGTIDRLEATLTVTVAGRTYACPLQEP